LEYGHDAEDAGQLEGTDEAKPRDPFGREPTDRTIAVENRSLIGTQEAADEVKRGRLSGAVWTDQGGHRPGGNLEARSGDRGDATVAAAEVLDPQERPRR